MKDKGQKTMKRFYEITYRYFPEPWDMGPRQELVELVESHKVQPGRAIDLGFGTGANAIYLAQHGLEVTGVGFAAAAIEKARKRADAARAKVQFLVDDLTTCAAFQANSISSWITAYWMTCACPSSNCTFTICCP